MVIIASLLYLLAGRLGNPDLTWVEIHLPLSAASFLLVAVAGAEGILMIRHWQERHADVTAMRTREQELAIRITTQRLDRLNEIAESLLCYDHAAALAKVVPGKLASLFESDVTAVWTTDGLGSQTFELQGVNGLNERDQHAFAALTKATPCFERAGHALQPLVITDFARDTAPALASFCRDQRLVTAVLSPVWAGNRLLGLIGLFYRETPVITPVALAELQVATHTLAAQRRLTVPPVAS
jgi:hypothetical protein